MSTPPDGASAPPRMDALMAARSIIASCMEAGDRAEVLGFQGVNVVITQQSMALISQAYGLIAVTEAIRDLAKSLRRET